MRNHSQKCLIALCGAISLFCIPFPVSGGGNPTDPPVSGVKQAEICFPLPDGERLLHVLESFTACQEAVAAGQEANDACESRAGILEQRVTEQDRELQEARKLVDDTRKAGEQAVKVAAPPWYQRVLNAGKWIALGLITGFVVGAGK